MSFVVAVVLVIRLVGEAGLFELAVLVAGAWRSPEAGRQPWHGVG